MKPRSCLKEWNVPGFDPWEYKIEHTRIRIRLKDRQSLWRISRRASRVLISGILPGVSLV
jgi:hypothetical protein